MHQAFERADIMIHGSGPSIVGKGNLQAWINYTSKPFGIFGVTIQHINQELHKVLENASFIYTRETKSLDVLKENSLVNETIFFTADVAASIYRKAFALLSFECHSPIIALANGTPAFYLRPRKDTIKGQMYYDLGFDDWIF